MLVMDDNGRDPVVEVFLEHRQVAGVLELQVKICSSDYSNSDVFLLFPEAVVVIRDGIQAVIGLLSIISNKNA